MEKEWLENNEKNTKKKTIISAIFVVALLVIVGGIAVAAFTTTLTSNDNTVNTGRISMSYSEPSNALVLENALPMEDSEGASQSKFFEFTVSTHATTNATDDTGITIPYEINISDLTIDGGYQQLTKSFVKVNLVKVDGTTETEVVTPTLLSNMSASALREGAASVYKTSDTHKNNSAAKVTTYRLRAWLDKSFDATSEDSYQYKFSVNVNSQVNAVGVDTPAEPTGTLLRTAILGDNNSNVVSSGDGLYVSTETNDGSPTYYYRGAVENNYVDFAGHTWRVIRINEDGTIRLMMTDENVSGGFNPYSDELKHMYYSESNVVGGIKKALNDWYTTNLSSYDSQIATSTYCEAAKVKGDESYTSGNAIMMVKDSYTPDFKCPIDDGNGYGLITDQKIGLITIDEVLHAGGSFDGSSSNYLSGKTTWLINPAGFGNDYAGALVWSAYYGRLYNDSVTGECVGLPVINLKADVTVTGTGEAGSHWVVQ